METENTSLLMTAWQQHSWGLQL